tara:strand:- start:363 stop:761 length:399 start_codon:yes stop_codon:yes gene_type:complete
MGLDMYLTGDKFTPSFGNTPRETADGFEVESQRLSLGHWRKHWALHNYIEDHYGDENHRVSLDRDELREIATAVEGGKLVDPDDDMPSYRSVYAYHKEPEQVRETVDTLRKAADWLDLDDGFWRSVEYHGNW